MAHRYVSDPRTIILCVVPANADMSTSDALKMARTLDPKGIRTVGVITKIDIMDKGTNAKSMLMGQEIPLRLGYVGIKNRSQQDINDKMKVTTAIDTEKLFFSSHPVYSTLPSEVIGTNSLVAKLTRVMFIHIKQLLPTISKEIRGRMNEVEDRLKLLGPAMPEGSRDKMRVLWNMVRDFCTIYTNMIEGRYDPKRKLAGNINEIKGGSKIKMAFYNLYKEFGNSYSATSIYSVSLFCLTWIRIKTLKKL